MNIDIKGLLRRQTEIEVHDVAGMEKLVMACGKINEVEKLEIMLCCAFLCFDQRIPYELGTMCYLLRWMRIRSRDCMAIAYRYNVRIDNIGQFMWTLFP